MNQIHNEGEYLICRLAIALAEIYDVGGVLTYISARNRLIGRTPAEAIRERNVNDLWTLVRHLDSLADGNFA